MVWREPFDSYQDGADIGSNDRWTVDVSETALDGNDHFDVQNHRMEGNDLDGEAVWISEVIDIRGRTNVCLSVDVSDNDSGLEAADTLRLYYRLDNSPEFLFENNGSLSDDFGTLTATQTNLTGNTLQIVIRMMNNASSEIISFDNVTVTDAANTIPEINPIKNQTVFVGETLSFSVAATDPDEDELTLFSENLPPGAFFSIQSFTGQAKGLFVWSNACPAGTYTSAVYATDGSATGSVDIVITADHESQIAGYFYGWENDAIVKLENGLFWKNIGGIGIQQNPPLYRPEISVTNWLQSGIWQMNVEGNRAEVTRIRIQEARLESPFHGLGYDQIFSLSDGTVWKQISFETSSADKAQTVWRWTESGEIFLRLFDSTDKAIGTCTVEPTAPPAESARHSKIDGIFYGWKYQRIFALADGTCWRQTDLARSDEMLFRPSVTVTNRLQTGLFRMQIEEISSEWIDIEPLEMQLCSTVTDQFDGMGYGKTYRLADGTDYLQISFEKSSGPETVPKAFVWIENNQTHLLLRTEYGMDIGTCTVVRPKDDTDRDGQSNADEMIAGADPLDARSVFAISRTTRDSQKRVILNWSAVTGREYMVEWTPSLTEPFEPLSHQIQGPINCWTDTLHNAETEGFYRVRVRQID